MVPTYVIHAKFLKDRARAVQAALAAVDLPFEWVSDFDAEELTPELEARYFTAGCELNAAQRSCALKHVAALERIRDAGHRQALVLEDDVILHRDFRALLAAVLR